MTDADVTVLVVEDEQELASTYERWLTPDYDVHTAHTGEQALSVLEDHEVDVVLLDRRLPGMAGGEVLDEIRERGLGCRVAMITAVDPDYDVLGMEFDDYVVKPVLRDDLRDVVDHLLSLREYDRKLQESYRLASTIHALEREKPPAELDAHEEYQSVRSQFEELQRDLDATLEDFTGADFATAYRQLESDRDDPASDEG